MRMRVQHDPVRVELVQSVGGLFEGTVNVWQSQGREEAIPAGMIGDHLRGVLV